MDDIAHPTKAALSCADGVRSGLADARGVDDTPGAVMCLDGADRDAAGPNGAGVEGAGVVGAGVEGVGVDLVGVLRFCARAAGCVSAALLAAVVAIADAARPGFDADEVAFALAWTHSAARGQVAFGRYLIGVLPAVYRALAVGDIDTHRAFVFYDVLCTVDDQIAADIADRLIRDAATLTTSQLRDRLRRAVLKADPDGAAARTRRSLAERYVAATPDRDGTASLFGVRLPAARTGAAFERVDAYARARKNDGDTRTLDQLRADTFLDLLAGTAIECPPVHRTGVIELTIPWTTVAGLGDDPGQLAGYGPIGADIARDIITRNLTTSDTTDTTDARDATDTHDATGASQQPGRRAVLANATGRTRWRYSITGPTGELLHHNAVNPPRTPTQHPPAQPTSAQSASAQSASAQSAPQPPVETDPTRRSPGPALTRWIVARDRTCRAPGCRTPAHAADIDHTIDHADGGPTSHDNLSILCRHHHRTKHEAGWSVTQPTPGTLEWTSPTGHTYRREPDPPD